MVRAYKRRVESLVGPQTYLNHPPHLTVYVAAFDDAGAATDAARRLAAQTPPQSLGIAGWHVFSADKLTDGNTLVCRIADADVPSLREFQRRAIAALAPLRSAPASEARYADFWNSLDASERSAVRHTGFPYVGEHWHPHLTIASVRQSDWPIIERELLADAPRIDAHCPTMTLYGLDDGQPVPVPTFRLAGPTTTVSSQPLDA
jgi:hypothetical protein